MAFSARPPAELLGRVTTAIKVGGNNGNSQSRARLSDCFNRVLISSAPEGRKALHVYDTDTLACQQPESSVFSTPCPIAPHLPLEFGHTTQTEYCFSCGLNERCRRQIVMTECVPVSLEQIGCVSLHGTSRGYIHACFSPQTWPAVQVEDIETSRWHHESIGWLNGRFA